jgi:tRNA/rRNA methyltransferase/tRNA (cytidine32/uridine32-2'-O)-methyltransferase
VTSTPRAAASDLLHQAGRGKLALVFGPENTGLGNHDLDLCHVVLAIPTAPAYRSLNLAQAALLVCYELWLESQIPDRPDSAADRTHDLESGDRYPSASATPAPVGDLEALFAESTRALQGIGFLKPGQEAVVMRRLRTIVHRARPAADEVSLLRAVAREINKYVGRQSS